MNQEYRPVRNIKAAPGSDTRIRQAGPAPVRIVLAFISVLVLLVSAVGYFAVGTLGSEIASAGNLDLGGKSGDAKDGATDILLVGSDSRRDAQGNPLSEEELATYNAGEEDGEHNTDTIMVVRVPNDGSSATAVSIPRDTYVHDGEYGNTKINGVFANHKLAKIEEMEANGVTDEREIESASTDAGRKGLIDNVAHITGVEVDHYAEVGLLGFVLLTDALGGVEVCLNEAVQDEFSGADFAAGRQTLNGVQALSFVRQRHGLPRGDLDRVVRQQVYMASMVNQVLSANTLSNPSRLNELSKAVERSMVIDEDWDIMSFASQLSNLAGGNVIFDTIPVTSVDGVGDYGESIITIDPKQVHTFMESLLGSDDADPNGADNADDAGSADAASTGDTAPEAATKNVIVLNAGSISGLATGVAEWLRGDGYTVTDVGNAEPGIYDSAQVVAADPADPVAVELGSKLGIPVAASESLDANTIAVVAAEDYTGPVDEDATAATEEDEVVGQPGADFGAAEAHPDTPEIDAGGGPRCVN